MPLAKYEAKGKKKGVFYPLVVVRPDEGWIGWRVIDPKTGELPQAASRRISRGDGNVARGGVR